jgi:hypothetical protein
VPPCRQLAHLALPLNRISPLFAATALKLPGSLTRMAGLLCTCTCRPASARSALPQPKPAPLLVPLPDYQSSGNANRCGPILKL